MQDDRVKYVPIGCQRCMECKKQKARSWQIRLLEDLKEYKNGKFITFTFSNESISELCKEEMIVNTEGYEKDNAIATLATRRFLERWRKKYKKSLRHWLVTEIGHEGTENIHIHGIIWTNEPLATVAKIWGYGFMYPPPHLEKLNYVSERTINYVTKYVTKIDEKHKHYKSIILTSPGIGRNYTKGYNSQTNRYNGTETKEVYRTRTGHTIAMPIYWRNKIYTEQEREILWLQRLDKNERWICGEKCKADDEKTYYALLKWHRKRNRQLGYGDDTKNWNEEQYEKTRRKIMQEKRIAKIPKIQEKIINGHEARLYIETEIQSDIMGFAHTQVKHGNGLKETQELKE